jgi:signal transduction histidine kinase
VTLAADRLADGFAQFVVAARELERSYAELKARADAVDGELRTANASLQRALAERDAVFAALPVGVCELRRDGRAVRRNVAAERLCAEARRHGVDLQAAAPGEFACGGMAVLVRRVPLPDGELVLLEDRSAVQRLQREVHRLDRLAGLSELALGIAHDVKNPLNGVQGFAALLARSDDPAQMRRFAGKIVQGVKQVDDIVKSLLAFARPERLRGRPATVAAAVAEAAAAAGIPEVRVQLVGARDARVEADALVRVLGNLMRNALEAAPAVRLQLTARADDGRLELTVQDDGPGVPAHVGERAFEPFLSTKERGTGLGLPLCVRVLGCLGGDIALLNPGEAGARFCIRMPLYDDAAAAAPQEAAT